jgi:hypothetical protein
MMILFIPLKTNTKITSIFRVQLQLMFKMNKTFPRCLTVKSARNTNIIIKSYNTKIKVSKLKQDTQQAVPTLVRVNLIGVGTQ